MLVKSKLGQVPDGLDERLAGLDAEALDALFQRLTRARKREVLAFFTH